MSVAACIIARGGSKRLPRKNVREFCGLPLVAWTVIQATCSHLIDDVWLSTDDDEIEAIGREYGAEVIRRPDWPDADKVAANRVYQHMFNTLEEMGRLPENSISMFPTSPLRFPEDIDRLVRHYQLVGHHPTFMARHRETTLYRDIGGVIAKGWIWDKSGSFMTGNTGMGNITRTSFYRWHTDGVTRLMGDHDKHIDKVSQRWGGEFVNHPDVDNYYVECEEWQCTEVDTLSEFELAEIFMQHYILGPRGDASVYYEYAEEADDADL